VKPSRELRNVVLGWYHDVSADSVAGADLFTDSDDAVFIGTAPGELWIGGNVIRAVLAAQHEQIGPAQMVPGTIVAFEEGTVGWASDQCTIELANGNVLPLRMTFVFHRERGEWKIVHVHASHGVDNLEQWGEDMDLSMETIAKFIEEDRPDLAPVTSPDGTVTIVFTDIESSTAVNESVGDDRFIPILREHHELLTTNTLSRGGSVVKSQGDGFMLAFPSARRAVECAVAIQRGLSDVGSPDVPVRVRMGMHTGEPTRMADDFYGRDVAYAARLGSAATGGEILVSSLTKSLVESSGSYEFEGPRELHLKGFDGPQPVYVVHWR
jgi:adenylate cyclase